MSSTTQPLNLSGVVVTDVRGLHWRIGSHIGSGGFGSIYLACEAGSSFLERGLGVPEDTRMAIKVEPHGNGSLFTEMHFYHRCAKLDKMEEWQRQRGLDYVGMPRLHGSGSFVFRRQKYRFIVIDRFGTDLQTILGVNDGRMPLKTALTVAIRVTDILEYVHFHGYVHKDVKAQNLLLGFDDPNKIYLVDFGLACRYFVYESGYEVHKELKEDLRRAHDGTIEFTSRDGHLGAHSRRSDLEVLLYNLIYWISGKLPWSSNREEAEDIASQKEIYMRDPQELMTVCFGRKGAPPYILEFANYVARLDFHEKPNYELCREMFKQAILKSGFRHDMQLQFEGGIVRIQTKRKCRKSFQLEKAARLRVEHDNQASLSGSSIGSVAATRSRHHRTTQIAGGQTEAGIASTSDDDDNDSSLSDRPSSVKRSCFDSRQSSGRRTGRHPYSTSQDQEVPQEQTVVIIDHNTKEACLFNLFEFREAQWAYERQRDQMAKAAKDELRHMNEKAKKAQAVRPKHTTVQKRKEKCPGRAGIECSLKSGQGSRVTDKIQKLTRLKLGRIPQTTTAMVVHDMEKEQRSELFSREPTIRVTRLRVMKEREIKARRGNAEEGGMTVKQNNSTVSKNEKSTKELAKASRKSKSERVKGVVLKVVEASAKGLEAGNRKLSKESSPRHVRFTTVEETPNVERVGMSLRNRRLPLTEMNNSK